MLFQPQSNTDLRQILYRLSDEKFLELSAKNDFRGLDVFLVLSLMEEQAGIINLFRFLLMKSLRDYDDISTFIEDANKYSAESRLEEKPNGFIDELIFSEIPEANKYMKLVQKGLLREEKTLDTFMDSGLLSILRASLESFTYHGNEEINMALPTSENTKEKRRSQERNIKDGLSLASLMLLGVMNDGTAHKVELANIKKGDDMKSYGSIFSLVPEKVNVGKEELQRIVMSLEKGNVVKSIEISFGNSPAG